MAISPVPFVVKSNGAAGSAPKGAVPIALYGTLANAAVVALTPIATPDATDPATTQALANANKAKINAIIAALKS